jgi:hypothetical protein
LKLIGADICEEIWMLGNSIGSHDSAGPAGAVLESASIKGTPVVEIRDWRENMEPTPATGGLMAFLPLVIISVLIAIPAHLLAKDKGRNVPLWTVLGLIPLVNYVCMFFFIGASNLRLEKKIDALLDQGRNVSGGIRPA